MSFEQQNSPTPFEPYKNRYARCDLVGVTVKKVPWRGRQVYRGYFKDYVFGYERSLKDGASEYKCRAKGKSGSCCGRIYYKKDCNKVRFSVKDVNHPNTNKVHYHSCDKAEYYWVYIHKVNPMETKMKNNNNFQNQKFVPNQNFMPSFPPNFPKDFPQFPQNFGQNFTKFPPPPQNGFLKYNSGNSFPNQNFNDQQQFQKQFPPVSQQFFPQFQQNQQKQKLQQQNFVQQQNIKRIFSKGRIEIHDIKPKNGYEGSPISVEFLINFSQDLLSDKSLCLIINKSKSFSGFTIPCTTLIKPKSKKKPLTAIFLLPNLKVDRCLVPLVLKYQNGQVSLTSARNGVYYTKSQDMEEVEEIFRRRNPSPVPSDDEYFYTEGSKLFSNDMMGQNTNSNAFRGQKIFGGPPLNQNTENSLYNINVDNDDSLFDIKDFENENVNYENEKSYDEKSGDFSVFIGLQQKGVYNNCLSKRPVYQNTLVKISKDCVFDESKTRDGSKTPEKKKKKRVFKPDYFTRVKMKMTFNHLKRICKLRLKKVKKLNGLLDFQKRMIDPKTDDEDLSIDQKNFIIKLEDKKKKIKDDLDAVDSVIKILKDEIKKMKEEATVEKEN